MFPQLPPHDGRWAGRCLPRPRHDAAAVQRQDRTDLSDTHLHPTTEQLRTHQPLHPPNSHWQQPETIPSTNACTHLHQTCSCQHRCQPCWQAVSQASCHCCHHDVVHYLAAGRPSSPPRVNFWSNTYYRASTDWLRLPKASKLTCDNALDTKHC